MDTFYRWRRYVYDITRFYLLGRDSLIHDMPLSATDGVLEIGCGTCRNLIELAKSFDDIGLFGLEASAQMLKTGRKNIEAVGLASRIQLRHGFAESFQLRATFGLNVPFDVIFFSYCLSMVLDWRRSVDRALDNLTPSGSLMILDFGDSAELPVWARTLIAKWLGRFEIHYNHAVLTYLEGLHGSRKGVLRIKWLAGRYAYLAHFKKGEC